MNDVRYQSVLRRRNTIVQGISIPDDESTIKKKFLIRLVVALHASGNLTFRTEKLINRVSKRIGVHSTCTILPKRFFISFQDELVFNPSKSESHTFSLTYGWDFSNLNQLEHLCNDVRKGCDFFDAEERLAGIEGNSKLYSKHVMALVYFAASFISTMLFYKGNILEAFVAGFLGVNVYLIEYLSETLVGLNEIVSFTSSFLTATIVTLLDEYISNGTLCQFGIMYGNIFKFINFDEY